MAREFVKDHSRDLMEQFGYQKVGNDIVLYGDVVYNYDDDCWRYAPDVFYEYVIDGLNSDSITEKEAREIVERNGGKNFDKTDEILYATGSDGYYSGF